MNDSKRKAVLITQTDVRFNIEEIRYGQKWYEKTVLNTVYNDLQNTQLQTDK